MERVTHREWVIDRNTRVRKMCAGVGESKELKERFFSEPDDVAKLYGVRLTDEEIYGIRAVRDTVSMENLMERLTMGSVAFFDANCNCPGPGPASW